MAELPPSTRRVHTLGAQILSAWPFVLVVPAFLFAVRWGGLYFGIGSAFLAAVLATIAWLVNVRIVATSLSTWARYGLLLVTGLFAWGAYLLAMAFLMPLLMGMIL